MKRPSKFLLKVIAITTFFLWTGGIKSYGQGQMSAPMTFTTWAATSAGNQYASDVAVDGNGDSYTVGFFKSPTVDFGTTSVINPLNNTDPTGNTEDGYLVKFDKGDGAGNATPSDWPLWAVKVGGTGNDRCAGISTVGDGAGGCYIYVVGWYTNIATFESVNPAQNITLVPSGGGVLNAYIARYDQDGNLHYAYNIGGPGHVGADFAYDVAASYDPFGGRGIYIVGRNGSQTALTFHGGTAATISPIYQGGGDDGFLVKYDDFPTHAVPSWVRFMASPGDDAFYSVAADKNGVSVGGQFRGTTKLQSGPLTIVNNIICSGTSDIIVANYDRNGTNIWYKQLGGSFTGALYENATCVTIDIDGNTYAGGMYALSATSFSCTGSGLQCFVTKFSSIGTTMWNQCGGTVGSGAGNDYVTGIAVDRCQKHVFVGGVSRGATLNFGTASLASYGSGSNNDNFFLELDAMNGSYLAGTGRVFGSNSDDVSYGLCTDRLDNVYMVGASNAATWNLPPLASLSNASAGTYDGFLWRFNECKWPAIADPPSSTIWAAYHRGVSVDHCDIYAFGDIWGGPLTYGSTTLSSTPDAIGADTYDTYFTRLDRFGNYTAFSLIAHGTVEERILDQAIDAPNSCLYAVGSAHANGNAPHTTIVGSTTTNLLAGRGYASIVKTDLNGTILWSDLGLPDATLLSSGSVASGVACDKINGFIYVYGTFNGKVTFGTSTLTATSSSGGLFVVKYTPTGSVVWATEVGYVSGSTWLASSGIAVDENGGGDVYVTGKFNGSSTWNTSPTTTAITSTGQENMFIARINTSGVVTKVASDPVAGSYGARLTVEQQMVYVAGIRPTGTHVSKWNFAAAPTMSWQVNGINNDATAICMDNLNVYITGSSGPTGSLNALNYSYTGGGGSYVASINKLLGIVNCFGLRNPPGMSAGMAIAQDGYTGNLYTSGYAIIGNFTGFVQEFSPDYCNYSNRVAGGNSGGDSNENGEISGEPAIPNVVNLFPNPSDGSMTLQISGTNSLNLPASLMLIDLSGRVVMQQDNIVTEQTPIDCRELAEGVYIYQIIRNNAVIGNGRIIITR